MRTHIKQESDGSFQGVGTRSSSRPSLTCSRQWGFVAASPGRHHVSLNVLSFGELFIETHYLCNGFFLDGLSEKNKDSFLKVAFFSMYGEWRIVEYNS